MKLRFSKKDKGILLVLVLMLLTIIAIVQLLIINPVEDSVEQKAQTLKTQQQLLSTLQSKQAEESNLTMSTTTDLQKKIPIKPLVEQLILDLEKAEVVSNSTIQTMSFTKDASAAIEQVAPEVVTETPTSQNTDSQNVASESIDSPEVISETAQLPAGIKKVNVALTIESPTYEDLETFILTLENQRRILVIDKIDFTGGEEITSLSNEEDESLTYNLSLSVFYMPELKDLQDHLPKLATPPPANKRNPLSKFSDTSTEDEAEDDNQ